MDSAALQKEPRLEDSREKPRAIQKRPGDLGGWEVCVSPLVWGTDVRGPRTVRVGQSSGKGDMGVSDGGSESRNVVKEATMIPPNL